MYVRSCASFRFPSGSTDRPIDRSTEADTVNNAVPSHHPPSFPQTPQAALDAHTAVDARGVRRPLDRALAFFPPGIQPSSPPPPSPREEEEKAAGAGAGAGAGAEGGAGSMDPALLRQALAARRAQVARLTEFRSRRSREIEARRRRTKVRKG
jgi:hypothetical protein